MLRALWFMIKVGLVVALCVWVADRPGSIELSWMGYDLKAHMGVFLLALIGVILLSIFIYNIIHTIVTFPASLRRYREVKALEKGYKAVTLGLSAVAAGDTKGALKQARRASKLMPDDTGLPLLLQAQAARLDGKEDEANKHFVRMLENKDTAFLGVRGLLQAAMDRKDFAKALELARTALASSPGQPWILRIVYDLEIKTQDWAAAQDTLKALAKSGAFDDTHVRKDKAALLVAQAAEDLAGGFTVAAVDHLKKAQKEAPDFVPASLRLAQQYKLHGKRTAAVKVIEKVWKIAPHPELAALWGDLISLRKTDKPTARLAWFGKLIALNAGSDESYLAAAGEAMRQQLWGKARDYLEKAEDIRGGARVYKMLAELEDHMGGDQTERERWRKAMTAAPPQKCWVCTQTGLVYDSWHWLAAPHNSFNTIVWDSPVVTRFEHALEEQDSAARLEAVGV